MDNEAKMQILESRVNGLATDLHDLKKVSENLVISATKHEEQLAILQKIFYGGAAVMIAQVIAMLLKSR